MSGIISYNLVVKQEEYERICTLPVFFINDKEVELKWQL